MSLFDLTIREADLDALRGLLLREDGIEAAAYVLCGESCIQSDPWERRSRRRLTVHAVAPIPSEDAVSASDRHVTWSTASYVKLLKRAKDEGLVPGIVHTHPRGPARFSDQDDRNEKDLLQTARNRNGDQARLVSLLLTGDGQVGARLWPDLHGPVDAVAVQVAGRRLAVHPPTAEPADIDFLARQALAFGPSLNARLKTMRVGVAGCGGTGSATAMLLARLGVGHIALFDDDIVDVTNLNRLHGARRADADAMRPKVEVVAREIAGFGLGVRAVPIPHWIGDSLCRDALKACDVIFGCTDDHDGRLLLNRLAYFYLIPVIDMGLAIDPGPEGCGLRDLTGRVTVLFPEAPCLLCRSIVDPVMARDEGLRRRSPEEYERRKREAYVRGGGDPAPAVVTFTTATACLAVDELLHALTGFRSSDGQVWQRTRRFDRLADRRPGADPHPDCPVCSSRDYWGRGDVEPFLDRSG